MKVSRFHVTPPSCEANIPPKSFGRALDSLAPTPPIRKCFESKGSIAITPMRVGTPVSSEEASNFQVSPPLSRPIDAHSGVGIDRQVRFTSAAINDRGIFRINRERSDVQAIVVAPERTPGPPRVGRLPDAAGRRSRPDAVRFFRMTNDARHPATDVVRTDALPHHTFWSRAKFASFDFARARARAPVLLAPGQALPGLKPDAPAVCAVKSRTRGWRYLPPNPFCATWF